MLTTESLVKALTPTQVRWPPASLVPYESPNMRESSPLVATLDQIEQRFAGDDVRIKDLALLRKAVALLGSRGIIVECILVGGSFLDRKVQPNDLDGLVVYRTESEKPFDIKGDDPFEMNLDRLDLRFVCCDASPLVLVKMVSFFSTLLSSPKFEGGVARGLVLIVVN